MLTTAAEPASAGARRERLRLHRRGAGAAAGLALCAFTALAAERGLPAVPPGSKTEEVTFADRHLPAVKVVRGPSRPASPIPGLPSAAQAEIVSFGGGGGGKVRVIRGAAAAAPLPRRVETVRFEGPRQGPVTIVRGAAMPGSDLGLFGPANGGELDRMAFAVDGVESRHGADLRMWRPEFEGPQGPMQISAAAALDVGGGDRFDVGQNRLLGRAYLARMFQRYGNWPDALAAYNWGPGNLDLWIAGGRTREALPFEVVRYVERVLRDTLVARFRAESR